jgi:hypothetical protein
MRRRRRKMRRRRRRRRSEEEEERGGGGGGGSGVCAFVPALWPSAASSIKPKYFLALGPIGWF